MMTEYICIPNNLDESCLACPCRLKVETGSLQPISCPYNAELGCVWRQVIENKQPFGKVCTKLAFDFRSGDKND